MLNVVIASVAGITMGYFVGYVHAAHRVYNTCRDVAELDRARKAIERFPF